MAISKIKLPDNTTVDINDARDVVIGDGVTNIVTLTNAEYQALTTKDPNIVYIITDVDPGGGGGSGTVTSVAMTVPTGLSVSGSPITTNGTLAVSLASGYEIPQSTSVVHSTGDETVAGSKTFSKGITLGENASTISAAGWYRVYVGNKSINDGNNLILYIGNRFSTGGTGATIIAISINYNGNIVFNQLSSVHVNNAQFTKVRVDWANNQSPAVDVYYATTSSNRLFVSGIGDGSFQKPVLVTNSDLIGTQTEFTLEDGVKCSSSLISSGSVIVQHSSNNNGFRTTGTTYDMSFAIGSGNTNRGIYSWDASKWMLYFDATDTISNYGAFRPETTNTASLGTSSYLWSNVYANAVTVPSASSIALSSTSNTLADIIPNITISSSEPTSSQGSNGDIWIVV